MRIKEETKNEIIGVLLLLIGILLLMSLITARNNINLVGELGNNISHFLMLIMGSIVSFIVPVVFLVWGITSFFGETRQHFSIKIFGGILFIFTLCALLSLNYYNFDQEISFRYGGIIGSFLTHQNGLNINKYVGFTGSYFILFGLIVISILLATDFLFFNFFRRMSQTIRKKQKKIIVNIGGSKHKIRIKKEEEEREEEEIEEEEEDFPAKPVINFFEQKRLERKKGLAERNESDQDDSYQFPPVDLLNEPSKHKPTMTEEEIIDISNVLEKTLRDFGIETTVKEVNQGPVVTSFELQPAPGVKVNKIVSLQNDLALALKAPQIRIIAPIPGKGAVGIEVPNERMTSVYLREVLESDIYQHFESPLPLALGKDITGNPFVADLREMPHLLIAGRTGSGKSVCINSIINSIIFKMPPERVKFIMIDPKRVELNVYDGIPHLLVPVVYEPKKAAAALNWAVEFMEDRYRELVQFNIRNIEGYNNLYESGIVNEKTKGKDMEYMYYVVIVIDELSDLMIVARAEVEESITRLAQMARAVGIHLIVATQRPSVNVITGIIKANFPSRIAFQTVTRVDSRTILDMIGAETLLGNGDMLFLPSASPKPIRIQGSYISVEEVERVRDFIRGEKQVDYLIDDFETRNYQAEIDEYDRTLKGGEDFSDKELFERAVKLILENRKASVSLIQRRLKLGYARAGRIMDMLEEAGIVGENVGSKPREILVDPEEYLKSLGKSTSYFDD